MKAFLVFLALATSLPAMTVQERRDYLDWMLQSLPAAPAFNQWVKATGELPPDFDSFPRNNFMPDPLKFLDGRPVRNAEDWGARRAEIKQLFEKYDVGTFPPKAAIAKVTVVSDTKGEGYFTRVVKIDYGPEGRASTQVTVIVPNGDGPFPVLIGGTASSLLRRGYIYCNYTGTVDAPGNIGQLYPGYDFASMGQVAFTIQTVVDYLYTMPQVDKARIAVTGYSRGGKMAMIAAAWDDRIAAVIAGSTGVGGAVPWRLSGEYGMGEGIETTTRSFPIWFHPRLRFFAGHEDRLPVEANLLAAMIAPRACLIEYGLNDQVSNTWADEQTYYSALKVYTMLNKPDGVGLLRVPGFHGANDVDATLDWLDIQFGRSTAKWDNHLLFPWDYAQWRTNSGEQVDLGRYPRQAGGDLLASKDGPITTPADWEKAAANIRAAVRWMLGDEPLLLPPGVGGFAFGPGGPGARGVRAGRRGPALPPGPNPGQLKPDVPAWVIQTGGTAYGWIEPAKSMAAMRKINFGYNVSGDLYYPKDAPPEAKLPAVIWLHGFSYPLGYMWVYRTDMHPILALVQAGYAVLAFDQAGFGSRMAETAPFYDRYPHWSMMGRMVEDAREAVSALAADGRIDPERISIFGYTIGGTVGLYTAALDPRVKAVVSVSGFTPMRTDASERGTGGNERYFETHPLIPRLGFFTGHEEQIPYDFDELIAAIAPRPVLIVEPTMDRISTPADVDAAVAQAKRVYALYNAGDKLALYEPKDYTRLTTATQSWAVTWMNGSQKPTPPPLPTPDHASQ
ncbi:MAG: alpha/beta fold hydrolase [Opitutaceae bacterium]